MGTRHLRLPTAVLLTALVAGCGSTAGKQLPDDAQNKVLGAQVDVANGCLGGAHAANGVDTLIRIYRRYGAARTVVVKKPESMKRELVDAANTLQDCQPNLTAEIDRVLKYG